MLSALADTVLQIAVFAVPVLLAVTLHEVAHGYAALRLGDATARDLGRLSLNPLRHVDPIGTVVVPALLVALGGWVFGWAKPVPVNPSRFRQPRQDMALVALAGPLANLAMGVAWALVVRFALVYHDGLGALAQPLAAMGFAGIVINTVLLVLNLLPLPPLDGGRVLVGVLPARGAAAVARLEPFGLAVIVVLLFSGLLAQIMAPFQSTVVGWLRAVAGLAS